MKHTRMRIYLLGVAAIAAVLVIAKVPFAGIVPFALVLGCGLMMFFMMKGMGGMGGTEDQRGHSDGHDPAPTADKTPGHEQAEHRSV